MRLLPFVLIVLLGCSAEEFRRGRPGDSGYIAPNRVQVEMIIYSPELVLQTSDGPCIRQEYSVVETEEGIRYSIQGRAGSVGDKFKVDISLLKEVGL